MFHFIAVIRVPEELQKCHWAQMPGSIEAWPGEHVFWGGLGVAACVLHVVREGMERGLWLAGVPMSRSPKRAAATSCFLSAASSEPHAVERRRPGMG